MIGTSQAHAHDDVKEQELLRRMLRALHRKQTVWIRYDQGLYIFIVIEGV